VEPDRRPAEHDDEAERDPQHHVDLLAAHQLHGHLHQRRRMTISVAEQHRRLLGADDSARDQEAEVLGREAGRGVGVALRVLEGPEEEDDGQKVEKYLHRVKFRLEGGAKSIAADLRAGPLNLRTGAAIPRAAPFRTRSVIRASLASGYRSLGKAIAATIEPRLGGRRRAGKSL
jgi:hypothetical protein